MQLIKLEVDELRLFCPLTGQDVIADEKPSPATIFIHSNDVGFIYLAPKYQKMENEWEMIDEDHMHGETLEKILNLETDDEASCVCYMLTTRGIACGPVSHTLSVGFDMAADVQEEE